MRRHILTALVASSLLLADHSSAAADAADAADAANVATTPGDRVRFGARAGLGVTGVATQNVPREFLEYSTGRGLFAGGFVDVPVTKHLAVRAELALSRKASNAELKFSTRSVDYALSLTYSEFAALGRVFFDKEPTNHRVYFVAGSSLGYLLSAKRAEDGESTEDVMDSFKSLEVSANAGIGFDLAVANDRRATFEVRYQHGLSNTDNPSRSSDVVTTNRAVMVTASYAK